MSLAEREKSPFEKLREEVIRDSSLPAIAAEDFRLYCERINDRFDVYFPLLTRESVAGRDYFLALIGAERPNEEIHHNGQPNRLLAADMQVILEEVELGTDEEIIGAHYTAFRA